MNPAPYPLAVTEAATAEPRPSPEGGLSSVACRTSNAKGKCQNAKTPNLQNGTAKSLLPKNDGWEEKVQELRRRQEPVAAILDRTFGRFAKSRPDLWERRAFLMLVGVLYQWLEANEKEVSTEELVTLSRMLAEQRRAEAQSSRESNEEEARAAKAEGELPENFGEALKQVYGTNFHAPREDVE